MSIKTLKNDTESIDLKLDNGDFKVLNIIKDEWKFKDVESLLRFALTVLYSSEAGHPIGIKKSDGDLTSITPHKDLLAQE